MFVRAFPIFVGAVLMLVAPAGQPRSCASERRCPSPGRLRRSTSASRPVNSPGKDWRSKRPTFGGDAKLQQALTADGIDIGIGSGPGMAFMAKGVPVKGVAAMAGIPTNMALMVSASSAIRTIDDLRGKRIGVTTVGSLTDWIGKKNWDGEGLGPGGHQYCGDRGHGVPPVRL